MINDRGIKREGFGKVYKNNVLIPIQTKEKIVAVRYAWKPFTDANLVNKEGLPTSTFQIRIVED